MKGTGAFVQINFKQGKAGIITEESDWPSPTLLNAAPNAILLFKLTYLSAQPQNQIMEQICLKNSPAKYIDCWVILDTGMCIWKKIAIFQMD